jgi:60 kDa SS-A/Ro ribonucleoprotein
LVRNLGNLTKHDLLTPLSERLQGVTNKLTDPNLLRAGRVHPFSLLIALKTYARGMGMKGGGAWTPVPAVVEALNQAFYLAFSTVVPSGKPTLYAIDVSGSMNGAVGGLPLTCAEAAAAMALICARTEPNYHIMGFTGDTPKGGWWSNRRSELRDLPIRPSMRLEEVLQITKDLTFGPTDCALPFVWAKAQKVEMDGCVIITDSETWIGKPHPSEALRDYRQWGGRPTRSVVMGMTATEISIADPLDTLSLDVVGLDSATPQVVADFLR